MTIITSHLITGRPARASLSFLTIILLLAASAANATPDRDGNSLFPIVKGKFGSRALASPVKDILIDYGDKAQIVLIDGALYRRPDSASADFFFIGRGEIRILDTSGLDLSWKERFGARTTVPFLSAYLCGNELSKLPGIAPLPWSEGKITAPSWQKLQFMLDAPDKYFGVSLSGELGVWSHRETAPLPVWVDLELESKAQLVFYLSPDISEQLHLYLYDKKFDAPYLLAGYSLSDQLASRPMAVDSNHISVRLRESGRFDAVSTIFFAAGNDRSGLMLNLPYLFSVDSALDHSGRRLSFIKKYRRSLLYLARSLPDSQPSDQVTVYYRGKFLKAGAGGVDYPINMTSWFPSLPHRELGRYTISYTLHKDLALISVGRKIDETVSGDLKTITYRAEADISYVSFAAGVYDTLRDSVREIPLTLYVRREDNQGLFNSHIPKGVLQDLIEAFASFYDWFGPPLAPSLEIVDQPLFSGQSSPGLIHLSQVTFNARRDQSRFRAHEVAHQWWGHTVVPRTYRDMWLSEGLAEFSAALYLLNHQHDTAAYRELVDTWRHQVLEEGKIHEVYSRGYKAGPIVMGMRLLQSYSPGDYVALVYAKAAYMLQMLRFEIDGPSYRSTFFSLMLADYARAFRGQQATSVDFIGLARHYLGPERARQFFAQWLYGWKIPEFRCGYALVPDDHGRPTVTLTIDVSGVDSGFATPFPVQIEFGDGSKGLFRLDGVGQQREFFLGPFPQGIRQVRFDPARIILGHIKEVVAK